MEKRTKMKISGMFCRSCSIQPKENQEIGWKKWLPNFCVGHIALFAGAIYILIMQLTH